VLATIAIVHFTRKNINVLTALETERMRPQLYFDLVTNGELLFAKLKNHGSTAAFDIEIKLMPKIIKKYGVNDENELKLASTKIAYLPPQKELEEFIDTYSQFMVYQPDLKFNGTLKYRGETKDKFYNQEINIDLSIHKVAFIHKKVMVDELAKIADKLNELVRATKEQQIQK
jgi:hypothetical protein